MRQAVKGGMALSRAPV